MRRSTILVIIIVSTLFSLLLTFFSYFGYTRFLACHVNNSDIENYRKLPRAADNKVVISFSVKPDKMNKLKPFINSILDQTVKVDLIAMIIPEGDTTNKYDIPKYIKDVAAVFYAGRSYGNGTKIIPMLLREKECTTTIIALNENRVYGQDFIHSLLEESKSHPESILVDKKGTFILARPEHFGCDVINREKDELDNNWFLEKASHSKLFNYTENYNTIGF
uniref:Glycosyltransferase 2-like domain-containing protein n=1 Tax=viral metagenome TaxID=1070528 RepID=A0A6C0H3D7_9ZZZZ